MKSLFLAFSILAAAPAVFADTVLLKNGNEISGVVTEKTKELVTIRIEGGTISLGASMVEKIQQGGAALEAIEKSEADSSAKLAAANQSRKERMLQFAPSAEEGRRNPAEASAAPASFRKEAPLVPKAQPAEDLDRIAGNIQAKLEILKELESAIDRLGIQDRVRLRAAVLSDLFPNYNSAQLVW